MLRSLAAVVALSTTLVHAWDSSARLTKPAFEKNLDFLEPGLRDHLPRVSYSLYKWDYDWIPEECKHIVTGGIYSSVNYNPYDFEIYDVYYEDCGDPWVFCHHKDSTVGIDSMASQVGRLPIQMRQYIRHVVDAPNTSGWAFEWDGSITFFNPVDDMLTVFAHETAHSLDLNNAYPDKPLSSSDTWWNAYNKDSHVPDPYSQTNAIEDVAQNTVVALFDEIVPGKFWSVEPNWGPIHAQYDTILVQARNAGQGNSLLLPGSNQQCSHRMPPSNAVPKGNSAARVKSKKPDVSLKSGVKIITTAHRAHNLTDCALHW